MDQALAMSVLMVGCQETLISGTHTVLLWVNLLGLPMSRRVVRRSRGAVPRTSPVAVVVTSLASSVFEPAPSQREQKPLSTTHLELRA